MNFIGEIAGLATSFFFALTAIIFTKTGQMIGSQVTNAVRLIFGLAFLMMVNLILFGEPLPLSADSSHWIWLGLSGVIGLSLVSIVCLHRSAAWNVVIKSRADLRIDHRLGLLWRNTH
jgi:uncharacterized membrane protein